MSAVSGVVHLAAVPLVRRASPRASAVLPQPQAPHKRAVPLTAAALTLLVSAGLAEAATLATPELAIASDNNNASAYVNKSVGASRRAEAQVRAERAVWVLGPAPHDAHLQSL